MSGCWKNKTNWRISLKRNCDYVRAIVHINEYMKSSFFFDVFEDVTQAYGIKVSVFLGYVCVT